MNIVSKRLQREPDEVYYAAQATTKELTNG